MSTNDLGAAKHATPLAAFLADTERVELVFSLLHRVQTGAQVCTSCSMAAKALSALMAAAQEPECCDACRAVGASILALLPRDLVQAFKAADPGAVGGPHGA